MKPIIEKWRNFIAEEENKKKSYQIYCDLDGVLVDFEGGGEDIINKDLKDPSRVPEELNKTYTRMKSALEVLGRDLEITRKDFSRNPNDRISRVRNYMYARLQNNLEFWTDLKWLKPSDIVPGQDGKKLWNYIKNLDPPPFILTAPMKNSAESGDHVGKRLWIENNLKIPRDDPRILIEKEKWRHAGPQNILIDDTYSKVEPWIKAGGVAIYHQNVEDTLKELKEYI